MLKDAVPPEIQMMVIQNHKLKDKELAAVLPPPVVQQVLLIELGCVKSPVKPADADTASEWLNAQRDYQERASRLWAALSKVEPLSQELARKGEIPAWAFQSWATTLQLDWSHLLGQAVEQAEKYLASRNL